MDVAWSAGIVHSLAALVGVAGVVKVGRPASAVRALRAADLPAPVWGVRALGATEVVLAAVAIATGHGLAVVALGLAYAGFAAFSARLLVAAGGRASCGCFGESSTPTSLLHVIVNLMAVALLAGATVWAPGPLADVLATQPGFGVPFVAATVMATWGWFALLVLLPDLVEGIRLVAADSRPTGDAA